MPYHKRLIVLLLVLVGAACGTVEGDTGESASRSNVVSAQTTDEAPTVEIISPADGADVLVDTEVLIYALAEDSVGVTSIEVIQAGVDLNTIFTPDPAGQTSFAVLQSWRPRLPGSQTISIIAYRGAAPSQPAEVTVNVRSQESEVTNAAVTPEFVSAVDAADASCRARINIDNLQVYPQAGISAEALFTLKIGEVIPLTGRTGDNSWWQAAADAQTAWISAPYTTLLGNCNNLPVTGEVAQAAQNQPPTIDPIPNQTVVVGETISLTITASDPEGSPVTVTAVESGSADIVLVERRLENTIIVQGVAPGQVSVRVTVRDGQGASAAALFNVVVQGGGQPAGNQPPVVEAIPNQTIKIGDSLVIPVKATDPEGFNPFVSSVESGSPEIATIESDNEGNIVIAGVSPGQVSMRVLVDDSQGGVASMLFNVTVVEQSSAPNQPPMVQAIPDQTVRVGQEVVIPVNATDPEGFNITLAELSSASDQIVKAERGDFNQVVLTGVSPGTSVITVTVDDGNTGQATISFTVTVPALPTPTPNQPPVIDPILEQAVQVGQEIAVFYNANDPEGFNLFISDLKSSADTIVTTRRGDFGRVFITGVSPGTATVTITVSDGNGGLASQTFNVTVGGGQQSTTPNQPPTIQAISNQSVNFDEFLPLQVAASDPEGGAVALSVSSSDEAVAPAQVTGENAITVYGAGTGTATITVTAIDPERNATSAVFDVTVVGGDLPELPSLPDAVLQNIQAIYAAGAQSNRYSVMGNANPAALPIGAGVDVSAAPELQSTLDAWAGGALASNPAWTAADLLNPANNPAGCENFASPLECAVQTELPSAAILILGQGDINAGTSADVFTADLSRVIDELVSRGVIPVLTTIPGDPALTGAFNDVIIQLAAQKELPLWNLRRAIPVQQVNSDLSLTSSGVDMVLSPENVSAYGTNQRNLKLLQLLELLRTVIPLA